MYKKLCNRVVGTITILVSLAVAVAISLWHQESLKYITYVIRFFDVMMPALIVGALIKFLVCGFGCGCHKDSDQDCCSKR